MNSIYHWIRRNSATILSILAAGGVVGTAYLSGKAAMKSAEALESKRKEKKEITKKEEILTKAEAFIPAGAAAAGTILCIVGANVLNQKRQALLLTTCAYLEKSYVDYKTRVNKLVTDDESKFIDKVMDEEQQDEDDNLPPWTGIQTFYLEPYGKFFEKTMDEVIAAEYYLNRNFTLRGYATLNEFLDFLHLPHVPDGDVLGWDCYSGETTYGYSWIDFNHRRFLSGEMLVCAIDMPFPPHLFQDDVEEAIIGVEISHF